MWSNRAMNASLRLLSVLLLLTAPVQAQQEAERLLRELYNCEFPMDAAAWEADWEQCREQVKNRVQLAAGLWPLPEKTPLKAVIHGRVEREDYTIDRVYFESFPGHYVTGNLYLPKPLPAKPMPGVLCPHGHWPGGRFMDAGADSPGTRDQLRAGAERFINAARSPLQARCVHLARMGCAVFHWDTLGNADSRQIADHRSGARQNLKGAAAGAWGLYSAMADLRLQTNFGLQTWNSVRALDFLESLPGVDKKRIAVTGASGGATQAMMLTAIDERVAAAFPCVMVSSAMQGGCTCENSHYLRVGQGNIDIAAAAAPRPLGLTSADDWTIDLDRKGFPELQALYTRIGKPDHVQALFATQFKHNYNQVSRAEMYHFLKRHFKLGGVSIEERDFEFSSKEDLTVWTAEHPVPSGGKAGAAHEAKLMQTWAELADAKIKPLLTPKDENQLAEAVLLLGGAWRMMAGCELPEAEHLNQLELADYGGTIVARLANTKTDCQIPLTVRSPANKKTNKIVIRLSKDAKLSGAARSEEVLEVAPNLYGMHCDKNPSVKPATLEKADSWQAWCGYTYGYNQPLLMHRVHDVLAVLAWLPKLAESVALEGGIEEVTLQAEDDLAAVAALAAMMAGPGVVHRIEVKPNGFRFAKLDDQWHPAFVPGAVKYGDLPALLGLCAPTELVVTGEPGMPEVEAMYRAADAADRLQWKP